MAFTERDTQGQALIESAEVAGPVFAAPVPYETAKAIVASPAFAELQRRLARRNGAAPA